MNDDAGRIVLIDADEVGRELLAARLSSLGFEVDVTSDAAAGAELALASPPVAVIADLWMPGISGVQLCRLLRAEPGTADVPVVLRAVREDPRSRFWAEQAGAVALVSKGRMGDLARVLRGITRRPTEEDAFIMHLGGGTRDIRDRIARHLDAALFESVIAAEVRALGSSCSFDRLFDAFSQLAARLMTYTWLAVSTTSPARFAIHSHPQNIQDAEAEARSALRVDGPVQLLHVKDEDALSDAEDQRLHVRDVLFGTTLIGRIAMSGPDAPFDHGIQDLLGLLGRELGGAIRMTTLVEQAQRLATTDSLTGLLNRRAFVDATASELERAERCGSSTAMLLLDVDHFKSINDRFGHATGDAVLTAVGGLLSNFGGVHCRTARWGGEEFVVLLPTTNADGATTMAEKIRSDLERTVVRTANATVTFTASIGAAITRPGETHEALVERADRAMYAAKTTGRNRVCVDPFIPRLSLLARAG